MRALCATHGSCRSDCALRHSVVRGLQVFRTGRRGHRTVHCRYEWCSPARRELSSGTSAPVIGCNRNVSPNLDVEGRLMAAALHIITADQRLAEQRDMKGVRTEISDIDKTSQLRILEPTRTLFPNMEAGELAVQGGPGDEIRIHKLARDLACWGGGPKPPMRTDQTYSAAQLPACLRGREDGAGAAGSRRRDRHDGRNAHKRRR